MGNRSVAHAYSDSPHGKRIYPKWKEVPHKPGPPAKRHDSSGTDRDAGVANPKTEEDRYNVRKAILEAAALENPGPILSAILLIQTKVRSSVFLGDILKKSPLRGENPMLTP